MRLFHALPRHATRWAKGMMLAGIFAALLAAGQFLPSAVAHAGYASQHSAAPVAMIHPPTSNCSGVPLPC